MRRAGQGGRIAAALAACLALPGCLGGGLPGVGMGAAARPADPALAELAGGGSALIADLSTRPGIVPPGSPYAVIAAGVAETGRGAAAAELGMARLAAQARSRNWLPSIGPSVDLSSLGALAASLLAEAVLFDNGRKKAERDFAAADVEVAAVTLAEEANERLHDALAHHVAAEQARAQGAVADRAVAQLAEVARVLGVRAAGGLSDQSEVRAVEARLAEARSALVQAEGDLMIARENFRLAVGRYPGNLAALPAAPRTARSLDEARTVALRSHPAIKQAQRESTLADINVERAKADMRPTVTARATMGLESGGDRTDSLGISLNQTLYAGGRLSSIYRTALAQRDGAKAALLQTTALVDQGLGNAWANLAVANASIEAGDRQVRSAQTAFEGVREEARLGARTTLDVLNAEQELLSARVTRVSAEATRYIGVYALLSSMGLLTVDHLKLGIPTYDPEAYYNAVRKAPATSAQGKKLDRILKTIGD